MSSQPIQPARRAPWAALLLMLVFASLAVVIAYATFERTRAIVASAEMPGLEGISVQDATATPNPDAPAVAETPSVEPAAVGPQPVPWDGANRVTVLVMGLDYRSWTEDQGPPLTDSMMLLTVDPINKTAGLLSIPRDLWVNIPGGFGYQRINTAYRLGEQNQLPDGGPGLAMATVEEALGVPVDYYALIEFEAFERFIDEIGGVKINVTEKITIDPLGDHNTKLIKKGVQTLPGNLALGYIRARKGAGDDFGRAERQQQVVLAIRDRILDFNLLPGLVAKSGTLFEELSAGIHTNLTLDQVIRLAWLAVQIDPNEIHRGAIAPPDMVTFAMSPEGDQILKPISENIRKMRDEVFTNSSPYSPLAGESGSAAVLQAEGATVAVLNGSGVAGLAETTADLWRAKGVNVVSVGNATAFTTNTRISFGTPKPYALRFLVDQTQLARFNLKYAPDAGLQADIVVVLGADWSNVLAAQQLTPTP